VPAEDQAMELEALRSIYADDYEGARLRLPCAGRGAHSRLTGGWGDQRWQMRLPMRSG
jgi:hypothetical protein